jgi:hypothetical protein
VADSITYAWFNEEKTILLCTYPDSKWTWDDFFNAFDTQKEMIDAVSTEPVHIIVDTRASHWLPRGGSLLSGINRLTNMKHPRQGHTCVVGAQGLIAAIARVATKLMGEKRSEFHLVETMEEAEALIAQVTNTAKTS